MSGGDEISRLVDQLGSGDVAEDEQVLALLSLHGRKVVEALIGAVSSTEPRRRASAVTALGRIVDSRARRTLTLALADRVAAVRAAAATALSAYPSHETASRLRTMLERETEVEVRLRATATLVDLFNSGVVEALDPLLRLARAGTENRHVRLEALKVLASLPEAEARAVAAGLVADEDPRLAQAASRHAGPGQARPDSGTEEALGELDSSDYFTYRRAATLLASRGEPVIPVLVKALRDRAADTAACGRVASVLREVARGRERTVARHLGEVEEMAALGMLVDVIGESRDRTALYHLKGVIDRLESPDPLARGTRPDEESARAMIVAKSHFYLARAGSRVAFDGLKSILSRRDGRLLGEILVAVELIGGRHELLDLMVHFRREEDWMKERIRQSFRRLMRRARVGPDDSIFARLDPAERECLAEILSQDDTETARAGARRPARRVDSV